MNLIKNKNDLYFEPNVKGYTIKDLKWLNSGNQIYNDEGGNFFFEAVKIYKGNVLYKKVYCEINNKIITRL